MKWCLMVSMIIANETLDDDLWGSGEKFLYKCDVILKVNGIFKREIKGCRLVLRNVWIFKLFSSSLKIELDILSKECWPFCCWKVLKHKVFCFDSVRLAYFFMDSREKFKRRDSWRIFCGLEWEPSFIESKHFSFFYWASHSFFVSFKTRNV